MKHSILFALLFVVYGASAQDGFDYGRFLPLEEGNEWVYAAEGDDASIESYTQLRVVGDTTIEGAHYWKVAKTTFDVNGVPQSETTCAVRIGAAPDYKITYVELDGGCRVGDCFPHVLFGQLDAFDGASAGTFRIGGLNYDAEKVMEVGSESCHGNLCDSYWVSVASDVGAYACWANHEESGQPARRSYLSSLIFARIGETTYGTERVSSEKERVDEGPRMDVHAYPNPFSHSLNVETHESGPPRGEHHVELYDILGRQLLSIPAGRNPGLIVLDDEVRGLPAGTYLLRIRSGDGARIDKTVLKQF